MKYSRPCALVLLGMVLLPFFIENSHGALQLQVTVHTDKESYNPGELVSVRGQVLDGSSMAIPFASVSIQANDPSGRPIHVARLLSSSDGSFADQFTAPPNAVNGGYAIYVTASKPGYTDAYSQAACIITPEFSHTPWLFFIVVLAVLFARGQNKPSKSALEQEGSSTQHITARVHAPFCNGTVPKA